MYCVLCMFVARGNFKFITCSSCPKHFSHKRLYLHLPRNMQFVVEILAGYQPCPFFPNFFIYKDSHLLHCNFTVKLVNKIRTKFYSLMRKQTCAE